MGGSVAAFALMTMVAPSPVVVLENSVFGRYRVLANLGHGGMAAIHLAVMEGPSGFNKLVVLKQILPEYAHSAEIVGMFLDEARLAARLSHSNVVQTNEVGFAEGTHFIAMEYLDGQPLTRILRRLRNHGGLPLVMHLQVIADLLAGLHYAHELEDYDGSPLGVVHCDVSPHNTFVTYDGVVKVVDFGVAKARTAVTATRDGMIKGKLAYMAPEQIRGDHLDRRADVFAVGVMLWEAATGARPWRGVHDLAIVDAVLAGSYPTPRSVSPDVSPALEAILLKALSLDRDDRYATAAELQAAVDGHIATLGGRLAQREIGKLLTEHFASERSVLTSVIEEQLEACATALPGEPKPLPVLPLLVDGDRDTMSPDTPIEIAASATALSERALTVPDSVWRRTASSVPRARPAPRPVAAIDSVSRKAATLLAARMLTAVTRRHFLMAALVFAVGAAGGMSLWRRTLTTPTGALPAASSTGERVAAEQGTAARSTTVHLQLSASPTQARFVLDDVPLEGNPFQGELPRDGRVHRLRVEAPGFVERTESITLDRNTLIDIELAREDLLVTGRIPRAPGAARPHASSLLGPQRAPVIVQW